MVEVVATNGETVAVAAKEKHVEIGTSQADAARERDCAAVDKMRAMAIDEVRKPG